MAFHRNLFGVCDIGIGVERNDPQLEKVMWYLLEVEGERV